MTVEHIQLDSGQHYLRVRNGVDAVTNASATSAIVNYSDIAQLEFGGKVFLGFTEYWGEYSKVIMGVELQPARGKEKIIEYDCD